MVHNLEKHPTIQGAYIAYDKDGFAFRVFKAHPGYAAWPSHAGKDTDFRRFRAMRLKDIANTIGQSGR